LRERNALARKPEKVPNSATPTVSDDTDYYETNGEAIVKFATPYVKT
jgi:hypothetical protein